MLAIKQARHGHPRYAGGDPSLTHEHSDMAQHHYPWLHIDSVPPAFGETE